MIFGLYEENKKDSDALAGHHCHRSGCRCRKTLRHNSKHLWADVLSTLFFLGPTIFKLFDTPRRPPGLILYYSGVEPNGVG